MIRATVTCLRIVRNNRPRHVGSIPRKQSYFLPAVRVDSSVRATVKSFLLPSGLGATCEAVKAVKLGKQGGQLTVDISVLGPEEREISNKMVPMSEHKEHFLLSRFAAHRAVSKVMRVPFDTVQVPKYDRVVINNVVSPDVRVSLTHDDSTAAAVAWPAAGSKMMFGVDVVKVDRVVKLSQEYGHAFTRRYVPPCNKDALVTGDVLAAYFALSECITKAMRWGTMTPAGDIATVLSPRMFGGATLSITLQGSTLEAVKAAGMSGRCEAVIHVWDADLLCVARLV